MKHFADEYRVKKKFCTTVLCLVAAATSVMAEQTMKIPSGSKVYVTPGEFGSFIIAAIQKKSVPVLVTTDENAAEYIITGTSESNKAGWARTVFMGQTGSNEEASIQLIRKADKVVLWAYNVHKRNSVRGKQSSAEACAKHLKEIVSK